MTMSGAWLAVTTLCLGVLAAGPADADSWRPLEVWRIDGGRVAPWAQAGTRVDPALEGREVRFQKTRVVAPHPLACDGAKYEWIFVEPEGLFEGNLPTPAAGAASRLGLGGGPIATLRVSCANAGFDFHRTSGGELLVTHFTRDMAFTRESVASKREFLSARLHAQITQYLAAPQSADEAPEINGDPFTNSQEYPDRFTLGAARSTAKRTFVPVHFADAHSKRRVDYVLVREGTRWVIDDLVDEGGQSLGKLLESPAGR